MFRLLTTLLTVYIGRSMNAPDSGHTPFLIRLPLLMLRRILQLFMIGFGSLLVGVIGIAFLVKDITYQLQTDNFLVFRASTGISILVAAIGFALCLWAFRKKNWENAENLTVNAEPQVRPKYSQHQPDFLTQVLSIVSEFMDEKSGRATAPPPQNVHEQTRENYSGPSAVNL